MQNRLALGFLLIPLLPGLSAETAPAPAGPPADELWRKRGEAAVAKVRRLEERRKAPGGLGADDRCELALESAFAPYADPKRIASLKAACRLGTCYRMSFSTGPKTPFAILEIRYPAADKPSNAANILGIQAPWKAQVTTFLPRTVVLDGGDCRINVPIDAPLTALWTRVDAP